jgi:hypothetical protein
MVEKVSFSDDGSNSVYLRRQGVPEMKAELPNGGTGGVVAVAYILDPKTGRGYIQACLWWASSSATAVRKAIPDVVSL